MAARVLVTGAGTMAASNLMRDLRAGDPAMFVAGCHADRFVLKKSAADANYLVDPANQPGFAAGLRRIVEHARIDLIIPTTDLEVLVLARGRDAVPCRLFLPSPALVERCQDKYELACALRARGVAAPVTYPIAALAEINGVFDRFPPGAMLWCRVRAGTGSTAAIPVKRPQQARSWIAYWEEMRGLPARAFTLSEYLPGRDFFAQGLWRDGELVVIKTCERLSHYVVGGAPSGVSSMSRLAKTIHEPRVAEVCTAAVAALDACASGTFNFDLKEGASGTPCITEINPGRFASGSALLNLTGRHNLALLYVRLALGEAVGVRGEYDSAEGHYSVRDMDTLPGIFADDELFEGIEDVRAPERLVGA